MKEKPAKVGPATFLLRVPENLEEARSLVSTDEDLLQLITFAFHHRLRSAIIGWQSQGRTNEQIYAMSQVYIYHGQTKAPDA